MGLTDKKQDARKVLAFQNEIEEGLRRQKEIDVLNKEAEVYAKEHNLVTWQDHADYHRNFRKNFGKIKPQKQKTVKSNERKYCDKCGGGLTWLIDMDKSTPPVLTNEGHIDIKAIIIMSDEYECGGCGRIKTIKQTEINKEFAASL